jgi:hypothetical protein
MKNRLDNDPLRAMTTLERSFVDLLLTGEFPGREEVREQLRSSLVRQIDDEGSLQFSPQSSVAAPVTKRIPVEGVGADSDGVPIYLLLHVVDARVRELEIYKADGSSILRMPSGDEIEVIVLPA